MWGSFKSYFLQESADVTKVDEKNESDEIEGWVLVDIDGNEIKRERTPSPVNCKTEASLGPLPLLDISNTSTPQSSPQLSPTKIEEGWFVAPPPCFLLNCPDKLEVSPLEDLLIEHPSMSVYRYVPDYINNIKFCSEIAGVLKIDEERFVKHLPLCKSPTLERTNERNSKRADCSKRADSKGLSQRLDLKNLLDLDQAENTKPPHYSKWDKWEGEQYKFCPSYIHRQNRVHRYQSRKHQNQKRKSLAKPFAEKCSKHNTF